MKSRQGHQTKVIDDIGNLTTDVRKPFKNTVMNERKKRMEWLAKQALACCVDKDVLSDKGIDCIKGNRDLASQVKYLLEGIKEHLQKIVHLNFLYLAGEPVPEVVQEARDEEVNYITGIVIYSQSTVNAYARIIKQTKELPPSAYILTKYCQKVESVSIR